MTDILPSWTLPPDVPRETFLLGPDVVLAPAKRLLVRGMWKVFDSYLIGSSGWVNETA